MDWTCFLQGRRHRRAVVNTEMELWYHKWLGLLDCPADIIFSRRTLLHRDAPWFQNCQS
jgi:hypothetical protein